MFEIFVPFNTPCYPRLRYDQNHLIFVAQVHFRQHRNGIFHNLPVPGADHLHRKPIRSLTSYLYTDSFLSIFSIMGHHATFKRCGRMKLQNVSYHSTDQPHSEYQRRPTKATTITGDDHLKAVP